YDRLASAERLHPGVVGWLPRDVDRIAEVGAGTGRLTMELIERGRRVVAVEPALPLRRVLRRELAGARPRGRAPGGRAGFGRPGPGGPRVLRPAAAARRFRRPGRRLLGLHPRAGTRRRVRPGRDGAGMPAGRVRGNYLAESPRLARRPRLPVCQLPRSDVGGIR